MLSTIASCSARSDRTQRCEKVVHNRSRDERPVLAGRMAPKENPKLKPHGKQRGEGKQTKTSDEGTKWLMEAWRKAGFTPFDKRTISARAAALGRRAPAVRIAARPAVKSGDLSPSSSSSSPLSSQLTPRTQQSASARKTKAAPLTVRSAAAAEALPSSSSAIHPALRAHHNRKRFENSHVAGNCYFEAKAVSNKLPHGMG